MPRWPTFESEIGAHHCISKGVARDVRAYSFDVDIFVGCRSRPFGVREKVIADGSSNTWLQMLRRRYP